MGISEYNKGCLQTNKQKTVANVILNDKTLKSFQLTELNKDGYYHHYYLALFWRL